jgi:glutamyl-tRNA synthetase
MTRLNQGRGRFAPSPTGPLHLGNLRTALLAWLFARHMGASFVLRVEDIDRQRTQQGCAEQMVADLRWLGLDWDEGPDIGGPFGPYMQSERTAIYTEHLDRLIAAQQVYPCYCSRADVAEAASAPHGIRSTVGYPGTCRDLEQRLRQQRRYPGRRPAYRFKISEQEIFIDDRIQGATTVRLTGPADDFIVWRSDGTPAYQLAVVVDDALMRVEEVVRGADLLESTPLQHVLFRSFGYHAPRYAHVPVWRDKNGKRLSKRAGSVGLESLKRAGTSPQTVVGMLAASCGLLEHETPCAPHELIPGFCAEDLRGGHHGA